MNKLLLAMPILALAATVNAQQGPQLTAKDYEHAENFLSYNTAPLIDRQNINAVWFDGDKFWYRVLTAKGSEFILVDPIKKTREAAFNQQKLAASLSKVTGKKYEADMLPFDVISFSADAKSVIFDADDK